MPLHPQDVVVVLKLVANRDGSKRWTYADLSKDLFMSASQVFRSVERAELGADFLGGVAAQMLELNPDEAQKSIFLVGSYSSGELGSHGKAKERASAFRMGYFYQPVNDPVSAKYLDFQNNRFAQIKHN